jgi:hypothetical protein
MYGIPYRACYSRNVPNLLLAGRLISATHLAHSSTRLMRTGGAIGQAVGIAATLCCKYDCTPRGVYEKHLDALQRILLQSDGTILGQPLRTEGDQARQATVTATSERRFNDQQPGRRVPLIARAGVVLWDWPPALEAVELFLHNKTNEEQPLHLTVYRARRERRWKTVDEYEEHGRNDLRDEAFVALGDAAATLPAGHKGWLRIPFPQPLEVGRKDAASDDDRLLVALDQNAHVEWALAQGENPLAEMVGHSHHQPTWSVLEATGTLRVTPPPKLGEAVNVVNGFHRRFSRGSTNMWISNAGGEMPQELILSWSQPCTFDTVTLTFDNLAKLREENPWECGPRALPYLVSAYELSYWHKGSWHTLAREEENYHRFHRHTFSPVTADRLRLRVLGTHGEEQEARVYQVRVTHEGS